MAKERTVPNFRPDDPVEKIFDAIWFALSLDNLDMNNLNKEQEEDLLDLWEKQKDVEEERASRGKTKKPIE